LEKKRGAKWKWKGQEEEVDSGRMRGQMNAAQWRRVDYVL
jgi:hypothetical protein